MSFRDLATLLGAGKLPFFPDSPSRNQRDSSQLECPDYMDQMSPGPPAHWKKGRAVGRSIQTSETANLSIVNGFGKVVYPDSSVYVGNMKERSRDGEGYFHYADGGEYLGQWLKGKKHGIGIMIFNSGARYAGEWNKGLRHGYGIYDWQPVQAEQQHLRSPSDISTFHDRYLGQWENDKMSGLGRLESANGSLETGCFAHGKLHGYGLRILKSRAQALSAASLLSGNAISGNRQVFVGHFEEDTFIGIRSREEEKAFQKLEAERLDKPWDPFASDIKSSQKQADTPSPSKRFPKMYETSFNSEDVDVCTFLAFCRSPS
jgi:hypothetical protein